MRKKVVRYGLCAHLLSVYGGLVNSTSLARVLAYPSADAVRLAHRRRTLPVRMFRVPHRKGWFAATEDVAAWLESQAKRTRVNDESLGD